MKNGHVYGKCVVADSTPIGQGGNSLVFLGSTQDGKKVAIKVLTRFDRYQRFRDEVEYQKSQESEHGILPLIDYYLPESPAKTDRPWLITPYAVGVRKQIESKSDRLHESVYAVREIARTLQLIHLGGAAHRDIKPENLFFYNERFVIGDFGLVSYPSKDAVTVAGERLGPLFYVAPELLSSNDEKVDYRPGDVYSLAKTLWVLCSGQTYPLPGHLSQLESLCRLSEMVGGKRVSLLDRLIDHATHPDPTQRPTASQFHHELTAWLEPPLELPESSNVSVDIAVRMKRFASHADLKKHERDTATAIANSVLTRIHLGFLNLAKRFCESIGMTSHSQRIPDGNTNISLKFFPYLVFAGSTGYGNRAFEEHFATLDGKNFRLLGCATLTLENYRSAVLDGGLLVVDPEEKHQVLHSTSKNFPLGSAIQENEVSKFLADLTTELPKSIEKVCDMIDSYNSQWENEQSHASNWPLTRDGL